MASLQSNRRPESHLTPDDKPAMFGGYPEQRPNPVDGINIAGIQADVQSNRKS